MLESGVSSVEGQFAIWTDPETAQTVRYSLPLFHELDFQVNEAYRRIPHGGVEIGGVLYGRFEPKGVAIEAFRPIECEHASGPSFLLSDSDLSRMSEAFREAQSDSELKGLERVGWFVSHTRSAPEMSAREREIFDRFFPGSGRLTLLIKPERFQPTRFVFSVRTPEGQVPKRDAQNAVILPLPGRAGSAPPVQSIPAPDRKEILRRQNSPERTSETGIRTSEPGIRLNDTGVRLKDSGMPPNDTDVRSNDSGIPSNDTGIRLSDTSVSDLARPTPVTSAPILPDKTTFEPAETIDDIRRRRSEHLRTSIAEEEWRTSTVPKRRGNTTSSSMGISLALVLVFASLLGCVAGYWAYLQLPPANIALRVEKLPTAVLVRWPPEQTRGTNLAAIRIDDGQAVALTEQQKRAGEIEINPTSDNVKIELISHHALRDSRGIIRYLRTPTGAVAPPATGGDQNSTTKPPTPPTAEER